LVHVEQVSLDVSLGNLAVLIDPEEAVLEFLRVRVVAGLVDSDGDGEGVLFGGFLEAEDQGRFVDGFAELLGLFRAAGKVVGGFGKEDGLRWCKLCDLARAQENVLYLGTFGNSLVNYEAALLQVVFQGRRGADLTDGLWMLALDSPDVRHWKRLTMRTMLARVWESGR
jgi:hypothetical protein